MSPMTCSTSICATGHAAKAIATSALPPNLSAPLMPEEPSTGSGWRISASNMVFIGLALGSGLLCLWLGGWESIVRALGQAGGLLLMVIPQLGAGLLIGGLIQQLVDRDRVTKPPWL